MSTLFMVTHGGVGQVASLAGHFSDCGAAAQTSENANVLKIKATWVKRMAWFIAFEQEGISS
jgi:hypothetical protein